VRVRLALPPASVRTPFDRFGDYVPWFAIAVVVIAAAAAIGVHQRSKRLGGSAPHPEQAPDRQ
jgi:apolipoprotein N-acyltransferase